MHPKDGLGCLIFLAAMLIVFASWALLSGSTDRCEAEGGVYVKTGFSFVCIKAEVIK